MSFIRFYGVDRPGVGSASKPELSAFSFAYASLTYLGRLCACEGSDGSAQSGSGQRQLGAYAYARKSRLVSRRLSGGGNDGFGQLAEEEEVGTG